MKFQIFGSEDSMDLDVMVFVEDEILPDYDNKSDESFKVSINKCHLLCEEYSEKIQKYTNSKKEINVNLAHIQNGVIYKVFKGTSDEVNNSLFKTYDLHQQYYPLMVDKLVVRDVNLKLLRTARVILSFWSRTEHREQVKQGLKGGIYKKIEVIDNIDSSTIKYIHKSVDISDYLKIMSFQLGQTISLIESGKELYTKTDIKQMYPDLKLFLERNEKVKKLDNFSTIELYKNRLVKNMKTFNFTQERE